MIQQICLFIYRLLGKPFTFLSFVGEGAGGIWVLLSIPKQYVFKGEPVEKIWCVNKTPKNASKFCNKKQIMTSLLSINKNSDI